MRRAAKRDLSEKDIVKTLRACGWSVHFISEKDAPDLVLGRQGVTLLAECKTKRAKLRPGQADWHANWKGAPVVILRSVDDALALSQLTPIDDRASGAN